MYAKKQCDADTVFSCLMTGDCIGVIEIGTCVGDIVIGTCVVVADVPQTLSVELLDNIIRVTKSAHRRRDK